MASWIKIFRELLQWEWFQKPEMVQLFIYLILKASCTDKQWQGITVKRGQLITSNATMRQDLRLSEQQIRTCIKRLISTGEITYKSTNRYVIITICNYDKYQETGNLINEQNNEQTNNQSTDEQRSINDQSTTSKEYKNIRSKEYNIIDIKQESGSNDQLPASSDEATASKTDKPKTEKLPAKEIKEMWNTTCTSFPKLFTISENRKNKMRLRIEEMGGVENALPLLKQIFEKMQQSKFLKGENKRGWKASFDWLFENDKNWVKVFEGNYEENKPAGTEPAKYKPKDSVNEIWK